MEEINSQVEQWANFDQFQDQQITLLSTIIFSFLANPSHYDIQENLVLLSDEIQIQPADFKKLVQSMLVLLKEAFTGLYSSADLEQRCLSAGIAPVQASAIVQAWNGKYAAAVVSRLGQVVSHAKLVDMDWSFGVTASTDECNSVGKTYVQLKLGFLRPNANENTATRDGTGSVNGKEQVFVEMNLEQFYQFLASIEKCKSCIELFNPNSENPTFYQWPFLSELR